MKRRIFSGLDDPTKDAEYMACVGDLIDNELVVLMKKYLHHVNTTCFDHSLSVSYMNYSICKKFNLDYVSAARAGLLHDFFLYDWHSKSKIKHLFDHPKIALENARKLFPINSLEAEAIKRHMWPFTLVPPIKKEAYVTVFTDKYCSCMEIARSHNANRKYFIKFSAIVNLIVAFFVSKSVAIFSIINDFF